MKIISNYLEEDGIGKQRSRYRSRRRRRGRRRRRRTFPFGRRQNEDGVRAGRHFATGARSAAAWPWSTWMKEERESEKDKTRGLVSPPPPPFQTQCARNVRLLFVFLSKSPRSESVERDRSKR